MNKPSNQCDIILSSYFEENLKKKPKQTNYKIFQKNEEDFTNKT